MDHVYTLLTLFVPCLVLCGRVPAPVNLTMFSQNLIHLLTWEPGPGASKDLLYNVTFCFYGCSAEWKTVDGCVAVSHPQCNLTDTFTDLKKTYYIKVTAISETDRSTPVAYPSFIPLKDGLLELPSLRVSPCNKTLCVYLQSPSERLRSVYHEFNYRLNVTFEKGAPVSQEITKGLNTVYLKVAPGVEYCVSVNFTEHKAVAGKPAVCASVPAAENNMDAVISVMLSLLVLGMGLLIGLIVLKRFLCLAPLPLVLSSFKPPYPWLLLQPSVESLYCISVEPKAYREVQVNEEVDQEKEDEVVAYEGRGGCEDVACPEEVSGETQSSLLSSPEAPYEPTRNPSIETCPLDSITLLKEHMLAPDMGTPHREETTPQNTTHATHLLPLTPTQELEKNDLALTRHQRGDDLKQEDEEDEEDSDDVNFFSLTLGSQNSKQEKTETDEKMENDVKLWKPEVPLIVLGPPEPLLDIQPIQDIQCSESTNCLTSYSEEEEEEQEDGMEEEEAFSGYMMREKKNTFL